MAASSSDEKKILLTKEVRELAEKIGIPLRPFPHDRELQRLLEAKAEHEETQAQLTLQRTQDIFIDLLSPEEVAQRYIDKVDIQCLDSTVGRHVQWKLPDTPFYKASSSPGWWALPAKIPIPVPTSNEAIALAYMRAKYPTFCLRISDRVEHISQPDHYLPMGH